MSFPQPKNQDEAQYYLGQAAAWAFTLGVDEGQIADVITDAKEDHLVMFGDDGEPLCGHASCREDADEDESDD